MGRYRYIILSYGWVSNDRGIGWSSYAAVVSSDHGSSDLVQGPLQCRPGVINRCSHRVPLVQQVATLDVVEQWQSNTWNQTKNLIPWWAGFTNRSDWVGKQW